MKTVKNERGAVLIWITLMIVLLMIMVGMGLDMGNIVYSRATGQAAVDAAALNAISALPEAKATNNANLVHNRAAAFVSANNYTGSGGNQIGSTNVSFVQYDFSTNQVTNYGVALSAANGVRVALEQSGGTAMKTPAFLTPMLKLFGSSANATNNVSVSAVSVLHGQTSIPIAMFDTLCSGGATVKNVQLAQQNPSTENSCWTTYLDKSSGASDIKALFTKSSTCDGITPGVDIGTPIYVNKGQVASVYGVAEDFFMNDAGTKNRYYMIPVIKGGGANCTAKDPSPIVDWAKIKVTHVDKGGKSSYIQADVTCNQSLEGFEGGVCFSNRLVREHAKGM